MKNRDHPRLNLSRLCVGWREENEHARTAKLLVSPSTDHPPRCCENLVIPVNSHPYTTVGDIICSFPYTPTLLFPFHMAVGPCHVWPSLPDGVFALRAVPNHVCAHAPVRAGEGTEIGLIKKKQLGGRNRRKHPDYAAPAPCQQSCQGPERVPQRPVPMGQCHAVPVVQTTCVGWALCRPEAAGLALPCSCCNYSAKESMVGWRGRRAKNSAAASPLTLGLVENYFESML